MRGRAARAARGARCAGLAREWAPLPAPAARRAARPGKRAQLHRAAARPGCGGAAATRRDAPSGAGAGCLAARRVDGSMSQGLGARDQRVGGGLPRRWVGGLRLLLPPRGAWGVGGWWAGWCRAQQKAYILGRPGSQTPRNAHIPSPESSGGAARRGRGAVLRGRRRDTTKRSMDERCWHAPRPAGGTPGGGVGGAAAQEERRGVEGVVRGAPTTLWSRAPRP
jgi:hypothetical protein